LKSPFALLRFFKKGTHDVKCYKLTEDEYGALLRHVYKFCWRDAAGSGKSAYPILHREPPLLKHRGNAMGDFKN
jgi:hypothetical protein